MEDKKARIMCALGNLMIKCGLLPIEVGEDELHWHYKLAAVLVDIDKRIEELERKHD